MAIITHWNATFQEAVAIAQARDAEGVRQGAEAALSRELGAVQVRLLHWAEGGLAACPELADDTTDALREPIALLRESYATLIRVATRTQGNAAERQVLASLDAELLVPMQGPGGPIGALAIAGPQSLADAPDEREALLEFIASLAATALERQARERTLETQLRALDRRARELEKALGLTAEIGASLSVSGVSNALLLNALGLATAARGAVALYEGGGFSLQASRGLPSARPGEVEASLLAPPALDEANAWATTADGELYLGLFAHGRSLGFLMLGKRVLGPYNQDEVELLRAVARHAAIAIAKARSYEALQRQVPTGEPRG